MEPDEVPDMSLRDLYEYIRDELGVPVTFGAVKSAVETREIVPTQISFRNLFSRRDAVDWIKSRKGAERFAHRGELARAAHAVKAKGAVTK